MYSTTVSLYALAALVGSSQCATNDQWAQRSIYQLVTDRYARDNDSDVACNITRYCGGTWAGIVNKLDYIADMGFTAVQISPIVENLQTDTMYGEAFHGYWSQNNNALNTNFGTADDLNNLATEIHNRGMYLLVDVVSNEMAYDIGVANMTAETPIKYAALTPFNSEADYHPFCAITDWTNATMYTSCWLGSEGVVTPTLQLQNKGIAQTQNDWIKALVSNYSIDGIRVDGAKQIETGFFNDFLTAANVYAMGEVDDSNTTLVCSYQDHMGGLENYPVYFSTISAFTAGDMQGLVSMIGDVRNNCSKTQYLANFVENQDNERFASYTPDMNLAMNAMAFTLTADGIPKVYYGSEQHLKGQYSPYNRQALWESGYNTTAPLYVMTSTLNKIRNHAININSNYVTSNSEMLYSDNSTYAARKGPNGVQVVSVLSNQGDNGKAYQLAVPGAADEGTNMTEVLGCTTVLAGSNGTINVQMDKGAPPKVFFPTFNLNGSGLCGTTKDNTGFDGNLTSNSSSSSGKKNGATSLVVGGSSAWLVTVSVLGVAATLFL